MSYRWAGEDCAFAGKLGCANPPRCPISFPHMIKASLASFIIVDELGDDLLLLAAGPDQQLSVLAKLRFGLSGAELARLVAAHRVDVERRRLLVLGGAATGDALLDDALASMSAGRNQPAARAWVARWRSGLVGRYLARLEAAGTVRVERRRVLGFIPSIRWVITDPARAARARDRLNAVATGTGSVDLAEAVLAGLASATGVAACLYPGRAGAAARKRLQEAAQRDPAAATVTQAVSGAIDAASIVWPGTAGAVGSLLLTLFERHSLSIHNFQAAGLIETFIGWSIGAVAACLVLRWLRLHVPGRPFRAGTRS